MINSVFLVAEGMTPITRGGVIVDCNSSSKEAAVLLAACKADRHYSDCASSLLLGLNKMRPHH